MGRITDSWSGKQKFHKGFGRKGNTKIDEYQQMLLDAEANRTKGWDWKPKKSKPSFEERLKRARDPLIIRALQRDKKKKLKDDNNRR